MAKLFGGFSAEFFDTYFEITKLEESEIDIYIYQLYHQLNHLNIFGISYLNMTRENMLKISYLI